VFETTLISNLRLLVVMYVFTVNHSAVVNFDSHCLMKTSFQFSPNTSVHF